jgi:hypothetical protein
VNSATYFDNSVTIQVSRTDTFALAPFHLYSMSAGGSASVMARYFIHFNCLSHGHHIYFVRTDIASCCCGCYLSDHLGAGQTEYRASSKYSSDSLGDTGAADNYLDHRAFLWWQYTHRDSSQAMITCFRLRVRINLAAD